MQKAWEFYDDVVAGFQDPKDPSASYGLTPKVIKAILEFKKIVDAATKIGKLNDEYGFVSDPKLGSSLIIVGSGHSVYAGKGEKINRRTVKR